MVHLQPLHSVGVTIFIPFVYFFYALSCILSFGITLFPIPVFFSLLFCFLFCYMSSSFSKSILHMILHGLMFGYFLFSILHGV